MIGLGLNETRFDPEFPFLMSLGLKVVHSVYTAKFGSSVKVNILKIKKKTGEEVVRNRGKRFLEPSEFQKVPCY
jgi:hypothetical protein